MLAALNNRVYAFTPAIRLAGVFRWPLVGGINGQFLERRTGAEAQKVESVKIQ